MQSQTIATCAPNAYEQSYNTSASIPTVHEGELKVHLNLEVGEYEVRYYRGQIIEARVTFLVKGTLLPHIRMLCEPLTKSIDRPYIERKAEIFMDNTALPKLRTGEVEGDLATLFLLPRSLRALLVPGNLWRCHLDGVCYEASIGEPQRCSL